MIDFETFIRQIEPIKSPNHPKKCFSIKLQLPGLITFLMVDYIKYQNVTRSYNAYILGPQISYYGYRPVSRDKLENTRSVP